MRHICFFIGDISLSGGTERVASVLANFLVDNGFDVSILSLQCGQKSFFHLNEKIKTYGLFDKPGRGLFRFPMTVLCLRSFIKKNNIDVLISVESMLSIYSIPALLYLNRRNICWEHFNYKIDLGKKVRRLARILASFFADDIVTLTDRDKRFWIDHLHCKAKVVRIYNPVPFLISEKNNKKQKLMLAVGRLNHQKGFDLLLQAWAIFFRKHNDWILRIVGSGEDELYLKDICCSLNICDSVEFHGNTKDIVEYYSSSAFYVMTSRFEGFPMVLLEAQEAGLPIISFDCDTGPDEIIINNQCGWLVSHYDINEFADKLECAVTVYNDNEKYNRAVFSSTENAKKYHLDNIGKQWVELLNE
ncbi:glycosyltransferase family 4 protein [Edwardsiella ictaluri]|uniref:glycosyltransferase family 4 protein n=1 Tax=Edwardsiella ictaluri TaxID=67780 RepID=UPI0029A25E45|nr:glycosyltransferase family 4 protein [Edwardsiella ictaluri]